MVEASAPAGYVTPDAVAVDLPHASVGSRGIAIVVDVLIMGTGVFLLSLAERAFGFGGFVPGWLGIAVLLLLGFALQFGYPIGFETATRGRTPGKMAMGLRVVTVEGAPVGFRHAALRAVTAPLELTGSLGGIAIMTSLLNRRGQRLGDMIAGTVVIRERRTTRGEPRAHRFAPPQGMGDYVAALDVSRLGPREYTMVRDVLLRVPSMRPPEARALSESVALVLRDRVAPAPPPGTDAVRWLTCVAAAVQRGTTATSPPDEPAVWGAVQPRPKRAEDVLPMRQSPDGFAPPG
jgi:uncharacterized RDD family membrane protein YckC